MTTKIEMKAARNEKRTWPVSEQIRRDIIQGSLRSGDKLTLSALSERYCVGASPIREALNRLIPEGLITQEENKGFRVCEQSEADLSDITKTRCILGDTAIRESIRLGDSKWEESLVLSVHHLTRVRKFSNRSKSLVGTTYAQYHRDFHNTLLAACGSTRLLRYCLNLTDLTERYRHTAGFVDYCDIDKNHIAIMEASINRDVELASKLLLKHYQCTSDYLMKLI